MSFPSTLTAYTRPATTDRLNNPSHSGLHNTVSSALGQVEAVIGVSGNNSVLGTIIGDLYSPGSKGGGHVQGAAFGGTGQTTFIKGDILVAQSASVISKLAIGTDGQALVADSTQATGTKWGNGNTAPTVRVYSSSVVAIWNKPSVISYAVVELQGGGGGGAGASVLGQGGGGGSAGGYARKTIPASSLPAAVSVLAGSFGLGGAIGLAGGAGQLSYFGSIFSATGGIGGLLANTAVAGGTGVGGDINVTGGPGERSDVSGTTIPRSGRGGGSYFGDGGSQEIGVGVDRVGIAGGGLGSGGGGSVSAGGGGALGGNGVMGIVVVYEY